MILEVLFLGVKVIVSSFPLTKKPIGEHFKENLRYNVIVTVYFSPRFCILGVKGREKQRGEGKTNDAKRDESGITRLLGVWAFHISSQLCSAGRTSPFWSHLRCLLVMFSSSGGELSQSLRAFLPIVGRQKSVCMERGGGEGSGSGFSTYEDDAPFWPGLQGNRMFTKCYAKAKQILGIWSNVGQTALICFRWEQVN